MHLQRAFITPDRVIILGVTAGREGMQKHQLFYSVVETSNLSNVTSVTTRSVTQTVSLAQQLIGWILRTH